MIESAQVTVSEDGVPEFHRGAVPRCGRNWSGCSARASPSPLGRTDRVYLLPSRHSECRAGKKTYAFTKKMNVEMAYRVPGRGHARPSPQLEEQHQADDDQPAHQDSEQPARLCGFPTATRRPRSRSAPATHRAAGMRRPASISPPSASAGGCSARPCNSPPEGPPSRSAHGQPPTRRLHRHCTHALTSPNTRAFSQPSTPPQEASLTRGMQCG